MVMKISNYYNFNTQILSFFFYLYNVPSALKLLCLFLFVAHPCLFFTANAGPVYDRKIIGIGKNILIKHFCACGKNLVKRYVFLPLSISHNKTYMYCLKVPISFL